MGERDAVEAVEEPITVDSLRADLRDLGVREGETLLVHSSLRSLGWVAGGAQAVVEALQGAVTETGTLVVPTFTGQYTDPSAWSNPPVPDEWVERMPERMPTFRPAVTPTRGMGAVPECLRTEPAAVRSRHPETSFAAWGADADAVVADHDYDYGLGEGSPLASIYDRGGRVLLLGVGHDVDSSLHLAEYRASVEMEAVRHRAPVLRDGEREMVAYEDIATSTDDFEALGADFEREVGATEAPVGAGTAKLLDQSALVDFAVEWFEANRGP
ncbi:aminoglycoside N(3)-acetyltransferase [Natronomonas marina]|jgi:aminoglycoside 3-N-acetyltransferase|uniref:aminoglycoside N(3)-acetyltransferase n=1 Tax=Natronomonas marina TaxID=2961939 RepID=UPI0020C96982|nr:AAC(3) family N-acetyltransferase [Natronomonas marina]